MSTGGEKTEYEAKADEKFEFTIVNEYFEEGFNEVIWFRSNRKCGVV